MVGIRSWEFNLMNSIQFFIPLISLHLLIPLTTSFTNNGAMLKDNNEHSCG